MKIINLRLHYPHCQQDKLVEVSEEVFDVLCQSVPIPLTFPVEFPIVPLGLFQIARNLGADLNRNKPPIDFDGKRLPR